MIHNSVSSKMPQIVAFIFLILIKFSSEQVEIVSNVANRYQYICGSDPYRFFSEFPCNMYPVCINGGFKLNVGCTQDYQCTPYSANAVCINQCCCSVPRLVVGQVTSPTIFFDNSVSVFSLTFPSIFMILVLIFV